jgi:ElaA protein
MTLALEQISKEHAGQAIRISAQLYLQKFYESFGFKCLSDAYLEDNIPHIEMLHNSNV